MKKPIVVLINGISLAGKDTFCMYCSCFASIVITSTVDQVKQIAQNEFGWDGVKDEKGRKLLTMLRESWNTYNNGSTDYVISEIYNGYGENIDIIFVMIREFNEMMYFKNHPLMKDFYVSTMWVERAGNFPGETEQRFIDMIPEDYRFDYYINNSYDRAELLGLAFRFVYNSEVVENCIDLIEANMDADSLAYQFDRDRNYSASMPNTNPTEVP